MATTPNFSATPQTGVAVINTANLNRDGTGTIGTVLTAGASGSRIERVCIRATVTTTGGMVRLYTHDGTNARLIEEVPVPAQTPSGTAPAFGADLVFGDVRPLFLPNGWSLRASTNNAESFVVTAFGGSF